MNKYTEKILLYYVKDLKARVKGYLHTVKVTEKIRFGIETGITNWFRLGVTESDLIEFVKKAALKDALKADAMLTGVVGDTDFNIFDIALKMIIIALDLGVIDQTQLKITPQKIEAARKKYIIPGKPLGLVEGLLEKKHFLH